MQKKTKKASKQPMMRARILLLNEASSWTSVKDSTEETTITEAFIVLFPSTMGAGGGIQTSFPVACQSWVASNTVF